MQASVLLVDDDMSLCDLVAHTLESRGYRVRSVHSAEEGLRLLRDGHFDVLVTDINMGAMSGVDLCRQVCARYEDVPVVLMTAYGTIEVALAAIRAGAYDFVKKPFEPEHFALVIDRAVALHALRREAAQLRPAQSGAVAPTLAGESPALDQVRNLVSLVANSDSTVLITGESGTGKELIAKALHDHSDRSNGNFVAINCAAMPESLLESELFGHSKGAYTDAKSARAGLFVRAAHGTIFLDEIGEMPQGMQAKLLRAVQERRVRPVGSDEEVEFDARIVAATHKDLETEVQEQRFREDLFYRINVVRIHVPPLRARGKDILLLANRFLQQHAAQNPARKITEMTSEVAQALLAFPWPGNVRQLQNCIERAVAVSRGPQITIEDLADDIRHYHPSKVDLVALDTTDAATTMPTMEEIERRYIRQVLAAVAGNKALAARILGFDRRTLYRKLDRITPLASTVAQAT